VRLRFILLGLLAFVAALLVMLPASWFSGALPPQLGCGSLSGSIWRGQCNRLVLTQTGAQPVHLDTLDWRLHPVALLRGRVRADVAVAGADVSARGELSLQSRGRLQISTLSGRVALDHARLAALPAGWSASVEARELSLQIVGSRVQALGGALLARQLRDSRGTDFGDFRLEFPPADTPPFRGTLTDDGGPMQLKAQLELNADQSWQMQGTIVLRPGSPPGLAGALDQLAPADINGLRSFRLEGTAR
jgi:general secretion pathway protein N